MNFFILDQQARGHALAWKLANSTTSRKIFLLREHPTPNLENKIVNIVLSDIKASGFEEEILAICHSQKIDCVIIGTIYLMQKGLVDYLSKNNISVIGATKLSSKLEGSKLFSKKFMQKYNIPTPQYLKKEEIESTVSISNEWFPCMLKSDSVVKGCYSAIEIKTNEEFNIQKSIVINAQEKEGNTPDFFIEKLCTGYEVSFTVLLSKSSWQILPVCKDYKKLSKNTNMNTGGMGSTAPALNSNDTIYIAITAKIIKPIIDGMRDDNLLYNGFLYFGIFVDETAGPQLLELNCRIGDPEAQSLFMLAPDNFSDILCDTANNTVKKPLINWKKGASCTVYLSPKGYPEHCIVEKAFALDLNNKKCQYFLGATGYNVDKKIFTTKNNRSFSISSHAATLKEAKKNILDEIGTVPMDHLIYREDILCDFDDTEH
jgi:phosphoribosylamine--glycine ligase